MLLTFARHSLDGMAAGMRKIATAPGMLPGSTVRMRNFQISPSPSDARAWVTSSWQSGPKGLASLLGIVS